jgi:hypothetical protein
VLPLPGRPPTRLIGMLEQGQREHITSVIRQHLVQLLAEKSAAPAAIPSAAPARPRQKLAQPR